MFEIRRSVIGHCVAEDGTMIKLRVAINDIVEAQGPVLPTGVPLAVNTSVTVSVDSPKALKDRVADRPQFPADGSGYSRKEVWEIVDFRDVVSALEEAAYKASDGRSYLVSVEIEPTIVTRSLAYKAELGNPVYYIRWSDKTTLRIER